MEQADLASFAGGRRSTARAMLARAFIAQNCAVGCAYGSFGITILPLQSRFDASRGAVSLCFSLVVLMSGASASLVAMFVERIGLRAVMTIGALLCIAGYALLAVAPSLAVVLAAYALLVGPGVGLSGTLSSSLLASGWYPHARGWAIGVTTMPILLAAAPIAGMALIRNEGLPAFYLALAALHLLSLPVLAGIRAAASGMSAAPDRAVPDGAVMPVGALLAHPLFWAAMIGGGLLNATGIIGSVHMVAVAIERGLAADQAALLASLMGGASVLGAVAVGWLCDRLGGAWALALIAAGFCLSWAAIALTAGLPVMVAAILVIGAVGPGVFPSVSLLFVHRFGIAMMPRAVGLFGILSVTITFLLPPAAGWTRDLAGTYRPVMAAIVCGCAAIAAFFCLVGRREPMPRASAA